MNKSFVKQYLKDLQHKADSNHEFSELERLQLGCIYGRLGALAGVGADMFKRNQLEGPWDATCKGLAGSLFEGEWEDLKDADMVRVVINLVAVCEQIEAVALEHVPPQLLDMIRKQRN